MSPAYKKKRGLLKKSSRKVLQQKLKKAEDCTPPSGEEGCLCRGPGRRGRPPGDRGACWGLAVPEATQRIGMVVALGAGGSPKDRHGDPP